MLSMRRLYQLCGTRDIHDWKFTATAVRDGGLRSRTLVPKTKTMFSWEILCRGTGIGRLKCGLIGELAVARVVLGDDNRRVKGGANATLGTMRTGCWDAP